MAAPSPTYMLPQPALELIPFEYIKETHELIKPYIVRTPVISNEYLQQTVSELAGEQVNLYFKAELLQTTGAFKVRGALRAVMAAKEARNGTLPGVVIHSSGNHGIATAYAAMRLGVRATILVPNFVNKAKLSNISQYGAEIVKVEPRREATKAAYDSIVHDRDYAVVLPYNQKEIMAGQATCAVEFIEEVPQLDAMLAPVSGGGLICGLALGCKHLNKNVKVFGVAPVNKTLDKALATGVVPDHWTSSSFVDTQCDALIAHPGNLTFPIMCELLEKQTFNVNDGDAAVAMQMAWLRLKLTLELSSATVLAAVTSDDFIWTVRKHKLRHIGLVLSGGNAELDAPMPWTYLK